jgi:hypothetical protein
MFRVLWLLQFTCPYTLIVMSYVWILYNCVKSIWFKLIKCRHPLISECYTTIRLRRKITHYLQYIFWNCVRFLYELRSLKLYLPFRLRIFLIFILLCWHHYRGWSVYFHCFSPVLSLGFCVSNEKYWCIGNNLYLYLVGSWFELQPSQQTSWLIFIVVS